MSVSRSLFAFPRVYRNLVLVEEAVIHTHLKVKDDDPLVYHNPVLVEEEEVVSHTHLMAKDDDPLVYHILVLVEEEEVAIHTHRKARDVPLAYRNHRVQVPVQVKDAGPRTQRKERVYFLDCNLLMRDASCLVYHSHRERVLVLEQGAVLRIPLKVTADFPALHNLPEQVLVLEPVPDRRILGMEKVVSLVRRIHLVQEEGAVSVLRILQKAKVDSVPHHTHLEQDQALGTASDHRILRRVRVYFQSPDRIHRLGMGAYHSSPESW